MERSRSPPPARNHFLLFGEEPGQRLSLEDLLRTHGRRTHEAPSILASGKVVPVDALFDWRQGDAAIADDAAFRWKDKAGFEDRLQAINATPRDHRCVFEELTHTYYVDGTRVPWSATTFSHGCEKGFDADAFLKTATASWAVSRGYCDERGEALSPASIKSLWERNGTIQSRRGTLLHWHIECHLNGHRIEEPHSPEFQLFLKFQEHFLKPMGFMPWRVEMNLFHCGLQLSGQADLVCKDAGDQLVILDWKRSKKINEEGYRGQKQLPPLAHLPNCNRQCYNLQLNTYRHILEKEYLLPVSGMYLVILHPDQVPALPFVMKVPRMELEIEALVRKAVEERGVRGDDRPVSEALSAATSMSTPVVEEGSVEPKASSSKRGKRKVTESSAAEAMKDVAAKPSEEERRDSSGSLIVAKAVRQLLKSEPTSMNLGSDAMPALNTKVRDSVVPCGVTCPTALLNAVLEQVQADVGRRKGASLFFLFSSKSPPSFEPVMKQGVKRSRGEEASAQQPAATTHVGEAPPSPEKRPRQGKHQSKAPQSELLGGGGSNALKEGPPPSRALVKSCVVRTILSQKGSLKTSRSVLPSFSARVEEMIAQAAARAREAGRSSLEPEDFAA